LSSIQARWAGRNGGGGTIGRGDGVVIVADAGGIDTGTEVDNWRGGEEEALRVIGWVDTDLSIPLVGIEERGSEVGNRGAAEEEELRVGLDPLDVGGWTGWSRWAGFRV